MALAGARRCDEYHGPASITPLPRDVADARSAGADEGRWPTNRRLPNRTGQSLATTVRGDCSSAFSRSPEEVKFSLIEVRNCFIMPLRTIRQQGLPKILLMNRCRSRRSGIDVGDLEQARRLRSARAGGGWPSSPGVTRRTSHPGESYE